MRNNDVIFYEATVKIISVIQKLKKSSIMDYFESFFLLNDINLKS